MKRYRVIFHSSGFGYQPQIWRIWFSFWIKYGFFTLDGLFSTAEHAEEYIRKRKEVKHVKL